MKVNEAKREVQEGWSLLGIRLPDEVLNFSLPYCRDVVVLDSRIPTDREMDDMAKEILHLSEEVKEQGLSFPHLPEQVDLGFALAEIIYGVPKALMEKVAITREIMDRGRSDRLDPLLAECRGFFSS